MKSLAYNLFKSNPRNMDDCMDYYLKGGSPSVEPLVLLDLIEEERTTPDYFLTSFIGRYRWTFTDGVSVHFEKIYGAFFNYYSRHKKQSQLEKAINRLKGDQGQFSHLGFDISRISHRGIVITALENSWSLDK